MAASARAARAAGLSKAHALALTRARAAPPRAAVDPAKNYTYFDGFAQLASGLSCGLAGLAAGMAIGIVGDAGVRATAQQPKLFVGMILILIFAEALALYGLIVGIILRCGVCAVALRWRRR